MPVYFRPGDERDIFAAKWELEFQDTFNFIELFRTAHEFLVEHGWRDPDLGGELWETHYFRREHPGGVTQDYAWWRVQQIPFNSKYVRYMMKIDFRGLPMKLSEIVVDGKKHRAWKGSLTMYCEAFVQLDYKNSWQKNNFTKKLDRFFRKRMYKKHWEEHKLELYKRCYKFNRELKKFYELRTPIKEPTLYRDYRGFKKDV